MFITFYKVIIQHPCEATFAMFSCNGHGLDACGGCVKIRNATLWSRLTVLTEDFVMADVALRGESQEFITQVIKQHSKGTQLGSSFITKGRRFQKSKNKGISCLTSSTNIVQIFLIYIPECWAIL